MTAAGDAEIRHETLRQQLSFVEDRLIAELGDELPAETIRRVVHDEARRFDEATVLHFIPVLVGRAARTQLRQTHSSERRAG